MAPGAVMIAMNGILGANSSPFGKPLSANYQTFSPLPGKENTVMGRPLSPGERQATMSNDMGMSGFLDRQAQAGGQEPTRLQNMGGGIGSLLEPIQAHLIQRYNEAKVVPLLNNFERQLMQLGSPQGGMGGYGGGMPTNPAMEVYAGMPQQSHRATNHLGPDPRMTSGGPIRATTMGPGSFGPSIASLQAQQRARVKPGGFDASAYLQ